MKVIVLTSVLLVNLLLVGCASKRVFVQSECYPFQKSKVLIYPTFCDDHKNVEFCNRYVNNKNSIIQKQNRKIDEYNRLFCINKKDMK